MNNVSKAGKKRADFEKSGLWQMENRAFGRFSASAFQNSPVF
jgi:hypothetical protein